MPLPAGFELETAPSRLPAGFELERSGIKLPPGFELENSPVQKMDKTALAKLPQFQQEQPSWLERHADTLYKMVEPYTMHGILSQPNRALGYADPDTQASPIPAPDYGPPVGPQGPASKAPSGMTIGPALTVGAGTGGGVGLGGTPIGLPGYTEDMGLLPQPKPDDQTIGQAFPQVFSMLRGMGQGIQQFGHDTVNIENLAMLPAFAESKLAQALKYVLGATMAKNAAEQVSSLPERATEAGSNPNASAGDVARLITEAGTSLAMPFAIGHPASKSPQQLGADAFRSSEPIPSDFSDLAGQAPPDRQIPLNVPPTVQRFSVDPLGQAADLSQLTPKEQTELLRGPKEFVPREQTVRPAQSEAPILGQSVESKIQGLPEGFVLEDQNPVIERANQAAGEPKQGGQISFESEAKADNVPTTNPTAVEPVAEESKLEQPDPNWEVRVQAPVKMGDKTMPGYVQIDDMSGGENKWSKGPASLKAEGFDIPEGIEKLPQGKYTMAEAIAKVKDLPEQPVEAKPLESAKDKTAQKGTALYGGMPIGDLEGSFKKIKKFLSGMNDSGLKTVYSEHGLEDQTDTPYVVFKEPSKEQIEKIQEAAEHVGASVDIRPNRTGVYFKGGIQKDVMQDWADFTHKVTDQPQKGILYSGVPLSNEGQEFISSKGFRALVTRTTDPGKYNETEGVVSGKWRVTYLSPEGNPIKHISFDNREQAIKSVSIPRGPYSTLPEMGSWEAKKVDKTQLDKPNIKDEGDKLYSGVPLMNLDGVKDAFKKLVSLNNPIKVVEGAKEMVPRVLDAVYGQGVERGFDESVAHLKSKWAGESAPHHTAISAELGNKMIEYASANATVDAYIKAGAPKAADYKSNALKSWLNQGIKDGVYTYDKPKANLIMGGRPMEPVSVRVKGAKGGKDSTLYVRADLAPEVKQVLNGQGMIPKAGAQIVLDALTRVQLFGPMDFVAHTANMYSTIVHSQGKFGNYAADLAARMPVAKQIDAIQKVGWQIYKVLRDDPATLKRLAELSEIGTGRTDVPMSSLTGKMIRNFDKGGRLVRDQMYNNLVKMKLTEDTVEGRREFINKMGQYNQKLMSYFMATAKNYVSPFVVAGRRFVKNATQAITLQNEVKAASPTAYAQMKFSNALSLTATTIAAPVVLNSILTGKPFGRAGTPVGKIDTGKDSKDGRPITIDLMKLDLTRRGLQATGMESAIEGIRKGSKPGDIASKMIWDMLQAQLHPWEGPAIRGGLAAEKEYAVSRDPKEALLKGGVQMNPVFGSFEKDEQGKTKGLSDYVMRVGAAVGVGKGNFLTHQEKLEQQTGKQLEKMSLEDRLKAERQLKDSQPKLSAEVRTKAAQRQVQKEYKDSQELQDSMPKATKGWLESRELSIPGYKDSIHIAGTDITLTDIEKARYKELVQAEYTKSIDMMKNDKAMNGVGFDNLPKDGKQIAFNKIMIAAKKIARGKLTAEIKSVGRFGQK